MRTVLFDFDLPATSIALRPASPRDAARMLVVQPDGALHDRSVAELPQWLQPGDQLVVNDTKVISAQLKGRRIGRETEPKIEATLIKRIHASPRRAPGRAEDRGDADQAPRRLALAGAGEACEEARARRHRSLRQ